MYKISVIIPSFKPAEYIYECLESLYNQDFDITEFEIILILNGCNAPYFNAVLKYDKHHNPGISFNLLQTDTPGVSNARNMGIDNSRGEYIAFIDDDDYVSQSYLSGLYYTAITNNAMPLSNIISFDDESREEYSSYYTRSFWEKGKDVITDIYTVREYFLSSCFKLISRRQIDNYRFNVNFSNSEDALFMYTISCNINRLCFADKNVIYYRRVRSSSVNYNYRKNSKAKILSNELKVNGAILRLWLHSPFKYNIKYTLSKFFATIKGAIIRALK